MPCGVPMGTAGMAGMVGGTPAVGWTGGAVMVASLIRGNSGWPKELKANGDFIMIGDEK